MTEPADRPAYEPERVLQALRDVGFRPPDRPGWLDVVTAGCAQIRQLPAEPVPTWVCGEHRLRHRPGDGVPVSADTVVCSCAGRGCVHLASLLVVLAFADPVRGVALRAPAWEVALGPIAVGPPARGRPGRLRYELAPPTPGIRGLSITPVVVRPDGATEWGPRTLDALRAAIAEPPAADLARIGALAALARARRLERTGRAETTRHLSRALVPLLHGAALTLEGRPLTVASSPVRPELAATRRPDGGLCLRWTPTLVLHWRDAGVVLGTDDVLALLPEELPEAIADRLDDPVPDVPPGDVPRFVDRLVVARGLPVALPPDLPTVRDPDARIARLTLSEAGGAALEVQLELVYVRGDGELAVDPDDPATTALVPGEGAVRRDRTWEADAQVRFVRDLGDRRVRFDGDAAFDFLIDRLPTLAASWVVYGRDGLVRHRVAGVAQPKVTFTDAIDWFDLDVTFTVGGRALAPAEVIASWRRGERYHRLDDGAVARLPAAWLARHAESVDLLAEVTRAQQRLGAWHAWMASDLLAEVGGADRWLASVRARRFPEPKPPPVGLAAALRPYQQQGLDWLRFLRDHGLHGLLADQMGLGKTVQALAVIVDTGGGPSLVVAPTSVVPNWVAEAGRFAPGLRVVVWHGPNRRPEDLDGADLVVTSYALLRRDAALTDRAWTWAVLDEAQQIKNPASLVARAARRLHARHRLALTGTPLENDLIELWSLFSFLMPGLLGRRSRFHARYSRSGRLGGGPSLDVLFHRLRPFVLRRRKADVAPELPPRTDVTVRVTLSEGEARLYERVRATVRAALTDGDRASAVLDGLTRLRQACCHPGLLPFPEARKVQRSAKLEALVEQVGAAIAAGSRCLVFSQWVTLLDHVADALGGTPLLRLQGDTVDRGAVVAAFQAPDGPPVLLVSLKAGGTGLNLTAADVVFLLDPWWNPAVEEQAADRAHRIGQTRPVTVVRLVAADTVEDRVLALQDRKRKLFDDAVDRGGVPPLTAAQWEALLA